MTEIDLVMIMERWALSTPGIWLPFSASVFTVPEDPMAGWPVGFPVTELVTFKGGPDTVQRRFADAQFVGRAHQDIPKLVAEIRRLHDITRLRDQAKAAWIAGRDAAAAKANEVVGVVDGVHDFFGVVKAIKGLTP